jgi:hypothetical protein
MTPKDFCNEVFDLMEINDVEVLFTPNRINRQLVPKHLFVYDIRYNDDNTEDFCTIEKCVQVNHTGTIISKKTLLYSKDFVDITDYNFIGEEKTLTEYMVGDMEIEKVVSAVNNCTYRLFHITINGTDYCVAEEELDRHIMQCIDNDQYHLVQGIDERFAYVVPQEIADTEDVYCISKSVADILDED